MPRSRSLARPFLKNVLGPAVAAAVVLTVRSSLADHYHVPSGSMEPTVMTGDHILVSKLAYGLRVPLTHVDVVRVTEPARGDVVVLESPETGIVLLKRVVAVPGDRVEVRDGAVRIDGAPREQAREPGDRGPDFGPLLVPADQFLVLGDNRGNSHDGRAFGLVRREAILGRALGVLARDGTVTWRSL